MPPQIVYKLLGAPKTRAEFLSDYDGPSNADARQQLIMSLYQSDKPSLAPVRQYVTDNIGDDSSFETALELLADHLYGKEPQGVRGKTDAPAERMESGMPTVESEGDKTLLADTPAATPPSKARVNISPAARKYAAELGVDLSQVTGSGKNGSITKGDIDKVAKGAGDAATPETAPSPADAAPAAEPDSAAMQSDAVQVPPAEGTTPTINGGGMTMADVDRYLARLNAAVDEDTGMPMRGGMPVDEAVNAMNALLPAPGSRASAQPPAPRSRLDMSRLNAANFPPPSVPSPRSAMDMSRLAAANPQTPIDLSELIGGGKAVATNPAVVQGPPPPPSSLAAEPTYRQTMTGRKITPEDFPVTSMKDKFMERMGLKGMAPGLDIATRPIDFAYRNPLLVGGAAAAFAANYAAQQPQGIPPEAMKQLDDEAAKAREEFENHFGRMREDAILPSTRPR